MCDVFRPAVPGLVQAMGRVALSGTQHSGPPTPKARWQPHGQPPRAIAETAAAVDVAQTLVRKMKHRLKSYAWGRQPLAPESRRPGAGHEQCGATRGVSSELVVDTESTTARGHTGSGEIVLLSALEAPAPQQTGVERREREWGAEMSIAGYAGSRAPSR
jgi:hypothetical protein